jgi:hypothetical protein
VINQDRRSTTLDDSSMNEQELIKTTDGLLTRVNLLRTQLMILATSYPTRKVRDLAREMPNLLMDRLHFSLDFVRARLDTDIAAQEAAETTAEAAGDKAR